MMRLVGKHVSKHCPASRPHRSPTPPAKLRHAPISSARQRIGQHAQTLRRALFVGSSSLLHRAPVRIQRRRTLQIRRRIPYPNQPAVMQMCKDGSNSPSTPRLPQRRSPPSPSIKVRQKMLIHQIIDGISLDQNCREVAADVCSDPCHSKHLLDSVILSEAFAEAKRRQMRSRRIPTHPIAPYIREAFSRYSQERIHPFRSRSDH